MTETMTPTDKVRAALEAARAALINGHGRVHGLPRTTDTTLAEKMDKAQGQALEALRELDGMVLIPVNETDENTIVFAMESSVREAPSVDDESYVMAIRDAFIAPYVKGE